MTAQETIRRTSNYMLEFMREIEKRLGRPLTPFEAASKLYLTCARYYAAAMIEKDKKGQTK